MSKNERITDFFIGKLLDSTKISFTPNGSTIKEVHDALKTASKKGTGNVGYPEFTAKSKDFILVIEDKANLENQASYEDEEETILSEDKRAVSNFAENGALHYARKIITKTPFKKVFAFGCSGNEKHHEIRPIYADEKGYTLLHSVENFENFSPENINKYYREQVLGETPPEMLELEAVLKKSKELHEHLRNYGQLGDKEKPLVVSAILLALQDENFNIQNLKGNKIQTDGNKIFSSIDNYMQLVEVTPDTKKQKVLHQFNIIKDRTLLNQKDERLEKTPLRYFTEYLEQNILSAVKIDTKEDVLGRFYGEFMRYGGGDGQTLGVILTPSHITELFCDLVDLKPTDIVFDSCCGTGGFLITAMHKMLKQADGDVQRENIKREQLHGIEIREDMFSIATTNMILRGDGKSNLENKDFLKQEVETLKQKNFTVGFMNPPYSQGSKESPHLFEICFVEKLLDSLGDSARCVVIVPQSTMVGKTAIDKQTKNRILNKHTLEGVVTLNTETFYGVGTNPCLAIFTANVKHPNNKYCKFINYEDDGFVIRKHIGLVETERAKEKKAHLLDVWLNDAPAESRFMVKTTIESTDEWLHSFYYFNDEIPKIEDFEKAISNYLTFEFNTITQGKEHLFEQLQDNPVNEVISNIETLDWSEFYLNKIFTEIKRGKRLKKGDHIKGKTPYVSSTSYNNGVDAYIGNKENVRIFSNCLSLANSGSVGASFYQPFSFVASDHVTKLKNPKFNKYIYLFIAVLTSRLSEKYSFNREINDVRLQREKILLPVDENGTPNYKFMESFMKQREIEILQSYRGYVKNRLKKPK